MLRDSPSHMLSQSDDFPSFIKNEEFVPFLRMLEKFCSFEQAEHLLDNMGIDASMPADVAESNIGEFALELLRGPDWGESEPSVA